MMNKKCLLILFSIKSIQITAKSLSNNQEFTENHYNKSESSTVSTKTGDSNDTSKATKAMGEVSSKSSIKANKRRSTTESIPITTITESSSTVTTTLETSPTVISMTITIDGDYDEVVGVDKQMFLDSVKQQLAHYLRIPLICIINMDSKPGVDSISVIFEMLPSMDPTFPINPEALISAKYEFEQKIKSNGVRIIDSKNERHRVMSSIDNTDNNGQRTENTGSTNNQNSYLILGVSVGSVVLMIVLIIITACAVRSYMYKKFLRQIRPQTASRQELIDDIPSRDDIPSVNTLRLMTGISREGTDSSGLFPYDSGVWVGNAPEADASARGVPEPPYYLPPKETEISITPKPSPEAVCRKTL